MDTHTKLLFSSLAIALTLLAFVPYIRSILAGTTKPHVFSWVSSLCPAVAGGELPPQARTIELNCGHKLARQSATIMRQPRRAAKPAVLFVIGRGISLHPNSMQN